MGQTVLFIPEKVMIKLSQSDVKKLINDLVERIIQKHLGSNVEVIKIFGVPRGGVPVALALSGYFGFSIVDDPDEADIIVDDIIDSGATAEQYSHYQKPFYALIDKTQPDAFSEWVIFPWEDSANSSIDDNIRRLLQFVGEDAKREGLLETPRRVAKAWQFWTKGYQEDPAKILKVFADGAEQHDQMITVKDIPIYSHCEHHLAPIFGVVTISYIPNGKIVGLSKLSRLADVFARRLQVQERMTDQIADSLFTILGAKGVGVCIKARHLCMESRGICQQGHHTITTALRGVIKDQPETRAEFLAQVK